MHFIPKEFDEIINDTDAAYSNRITKESSQSNLLTI